MERRAALLTLAAGTALAVLPADAAPAADSSAAPEEGPLPEWPRPAETVRGGMRYRALGKTGVEVSLVGLGGHHIGRPKDEGAALRLIHSAIDQGITFLDNCWDYHDGKSEERMGKALRDGRRQKVFLMTKLDGRTRKAAAQQIDQSLKRLQTDHIDLMQIHEVIRMEDADRCFAPGGAVEALKAAQQAGKIRFVGFTGHKDPAIHLRMLEVAAQHGFHFDAVQMPLNLLDAHVRSFARRVIPVALQQGVAILGMKSMGDGLVLQSKAASAPECLRYAMNLPVSTVITGIERQEILDQALRAAREFKPFERPALAALLDRTRTAALSGRYELFKTTQRFDGTARNPEWLG